MSAKNIYRISFLNQGKVYEVYAKNVGQGHIFGFVEIEELVFGEKTAMVIDPSEERLKNEFAGVSRFHVPLHSIIRIDEVEKKGVSKIIPLNGKTDNVTAFPSGLYTPPKEPRSES